MEFLRSCYSSSWRLFRDRPDVLTPGRYFFVADDVPDAPLPHYLGSRNWTQNEWPADGGLGEVLEGKQAWYRGTAPAPLPAVRVLGQAECILSGETTPPSHEGPTCISAAVKGEADCLAIHMAGESMVVRVTTAVADQQEVNGVEVVCHPAAVDTWEGTFDAGTGPWLFTLVCGGPFGMGFILFKDFTHLFFIAKPSKFSKPPFWEWTFAEAGVTANAWIEGQGLEPDRPFSPCPPAPPIGTIPKTPYLDVGSPATWLRLAEVIGKLYDGAAQAEAELRGIVGPDPVITAVPDGTSVVPGSVISVDPRQSVVCITGTSNPTQAASQVAYAGIGLIDVGAFSTNGTWWFAQGSIQARINAAGVNPTGPILVAGHSYGGALAALLAIQYKVAHPNRDVQLLTLGCPRPGDARLKALARPLRKVVLANRGDVLTVLPPDLSTWAWLGTLFGLPLANQWNASRALAGQWLLAPDGSIEDSDAPAVGLAELVDALTTIAAGDPLGAVAAHGIAAYIARLG